MNLKTLRNIVLLLILFFILSIAINYIETITSYNSLVISTILLTLMCIYPLGLLLIKKVNFLEPIIPISVTFLLFFCIRPMYVLINKDYGFFYAVGVNLSDASQAQWVVTISYLLFLIAYFFNKPNLKIKIPNIDFDVNSSKINSTLIFLIIFPVFLLYLKSNGPIGYGNVIKNDFNQNAYFYQSKSILFTIGYFTVVLSLVKKLKPIYMLLINIPLLWIIFTGGSRIPIIMYFLAVLVLWIVIRKGENRSIPFFRIFVGGSLLVIIMNWIGRIRSSLTSAGVVGDIEYTISESINMMFSSKGDFNIFDTWSKVYGDRDALPLNYGSAFVQLLTHPIPRSLWENKPSVTSEIYMERLMPQYFYKGIGFSASILGDYLMMFGTAGVLILMFISGFVCKKIYLRTVTSSKLSSWIMYAPFYGWIPLIIRGEIVTTTVLLLAYIIPIIVITKQKIFNINFSLRKNNDFKVKQTWVK